jgi:hypothetical protein
LYGVTEQGEVSLLAAIPPSWNSTSLPRSLREFLVVERALLSSGSLGTTVEIEAEVQEGETQTDEPIPSRLVLESTGYLSDENGRELEPFAMVAPGEPQRIAAVLLRPVNGNGYIRPSTALLSQVAEELVARNDVSGLALDM